MLNGIGPASLVILAVNLGLGIATLSNPRLIERLVFRPYDYARNRNRYTIILSAFAHADLPHLAFNMITFYYFGATLLEGRIGTPLFITLYTLGLVLSQGLSYRKHRNNPEYATLGASGAISAVLFAAIVYYPTMSLYLFFAIPIPAVLFAVGYLAYSWWSSRQNRGRINHDAHFGGAVAGLLFVALTDPRAWSRALHMVTG
jgi:membrane associated rhomboid family serine protease